MKCLITLTHNVTLVLDCCHSEHMGHGDVQAKAWSAIPYSYIDSHMVRLHNEGVIQDRNFVEGNPYVVAASGKEAA